MKNSNKPTRSNKNGKNRTISRIVTLIITVTVVLMLLIFGIWLIGGGEDNASNESMEAFSSNIESSSAPTKEESIEKNSSSEQVQKESKEIKKNEEEKIEKEKNEDVKTEKIDPSDDNVTSAVTGNWKPVETEQEGKHTTNYTNGSQDRIEIKQASANATGISVEEMIEWRVENNGDQKVVATVSDTQQTKTFRVFLTWIENKGWQPNKVEQLKVNDQQ
ncbi:MAG: YrrS family protein [Carnobacterium sp.]|uniref:YrrS family protein n=1 Tax=Carnobacterium sp. TaxID=48221 RepID=UPI003C73482C